MSKTRLEQPHKPVYYLLREYEPHLYLILCISIFILGVIFALYGQNIQLRILKFWKDLWV